MEDQNLKPFDGVLDAPSSGTLQPFSGALDGEEPKRGLKGWGQDIAATAVKGAIAIPEAAVGLADILTGGRVGKFLENEGGAVGFRPKQTREIVNDWHSDATKEAQRKFQEADGIVDKAVTAVQNPSPGGRQRWRVDPHHDRWRGDWPGAPGCNAPGADGGQGRRARRGCR
ncbi:hypothetical protein GO496_24470 [Acidovorax citrulli]|nr:hypothetical protein [Paracidovorax citrulli]